MEIGIRLAAATFSTLALVASPAFAQGALSDVERNGAFEAAGFKQVKGEWRSCDAPEGSIYMPGQVEQTRDLNGDGLPEVIITEGSTICYGGDEVGFFLVSQQPDSSWKLMLASEGIAKILDGKVRGWPEIKVGGQGFCFPVQRWNGSEYEINRFQYEGKVCKPNG